MIPSPPKMDCFDIFGLPARFDVDVEALRQRYFRLSRDTHPDRAAEQSGEGLRRSADANRAYEVLRDPITRAEHLLELAGGASAADDRSVPPDVLQQTLLIREEAEEAGDDTAKRSPLRASVAASHAAELKQIESLARLLPGDDGVRSALRSRLNAMRYWQRLLEQFDG